MTCQSCGNHQRGFTLIELMIASTLFLILSLAIFGILASSEGQKRTTTSVNDIDRNANYVLLRLGNLLRSAGAGFSAKSIAPAGSGVPADYQRSFGCKLNATNGTTTLLPPPAALPKPFDNITTTNIRLAPVIIVANGSNLTSTTTPANTSDVLIIMSSTGGFSQTGIPFTGAVSGNSLNLLSSIGLSPNDLLLIADTAGNCQVEQVASTFTAATPTTASRPDVATGGTYATAIPANYDLNSIVFNLGNITDSHPPNFLMFGVGPDNSNTSAVGRALYGYDLLQATSTTVDLIAEGVYELHALYGVDATGNGVVTAWVDPSVTTPTDYTAATLLNGTPASLTKLLSIKAIRLGLVMRTPLAEKNNISTVDISASGVMTLFPDLTDASGASLAHTVTVTDNYYGQNYRWRTYEETIALHNPLN